MINRCLAIAMGAAVALPALAQDSEPASQPAAEAAQSYEFPEIGQVETVGHDEALAVLESHGSRLLVVNFWATWCGPCVAELPYFVQAQKAYGDKGVLVVGYNMDIPVFAEESEQVAEQTIAKKSLNYPNLMLDVDSSITFPEISDEWSGALPATFYYDAEGTLLFERLEEVDQETLNADIERLLADLEGN